VSTPDEWVSLIKEACKTKPFMVTRMKQEDIKGLQSLQEKIMKKDKCSDCTPVNFSEAIAFKFNNEEPSKMHVKIFTVIYTALSISHHQKERISNTG
jgi:hypothetical protein